MAGTMMLRKEDLKNLPPLYAQDGKGDAATVWVKFFCPWNQWTWFATEFCPETRTFFGLVVGQETELGYFSLDELESVRGRWGLKIERDRHFEPVTLGTLRRRLEAAA
jgi:hypothetical protein